MSAMETMVRTILSSLDIDVEAMKSEVTTRIVDFENNVKTLNSTLITLMQRTSAIENKLDLLLLHHGIAQPQTVSEKPPATEGTINGSGTISPAKLSKAN